MYIYISLRVIPVLLRAKSHVTNGTRIPTSSGSRSPQDHTAIHGNVLERNMEACSLQIASTASSNLIHSS